MSFLNDIPHFKDRDSAELEEFEAAFQFREIKKGEHLAFEGDSVGKFFILLNGRIRVYKLTETGDEITLYYVEAKESCTLTAYAALSRSQITANARAETGLKLALINADKFRDWSKKYDIWSDWLFETMNQRLVSVMNRMELKRSLNMRDQVLHFLEAYHRQAVEEIHITHAEIAAELNSNRVVISRILEGLQDEGMIQLGRAKIRLLK